MRVGEFLQQIRMTRAAGPRSRASFFFGTSLTPVSDFARSNRKKEPSKTWQG
jgi:hypothetical protein